MADWWTRETVATWARQNLPPEFTRRDVGIACRVNGWHWSRHIGIVAALQRHGLVEERREGFGKRKVAVFKLRDVVVLDQEREQDIIEAQALMRIGPGLQDIEDRRVTELRHAFAED